jgi:glycosyltransferase involved in cell wall biosynthesis
VIVDPRKRIQREDSDVIFRHNRYAQALSRISLNAINIMVILQPATKGIQSFEKVSENLYIMRSQTLFYGNLFRVVNFVTKMNEHQLVPTVLIAGDPDVSFFNTKLIQRFISKKFGRQVPIQIQVHSELTWKYARSGFTNFFKFIYAKFSLKWADSIRATSNQHAKDLVLNFNVDSNILEVVPVPLSIDLQTVSIYSSHRPNSIGFVGRIHSERNLSLFVKLVELLVKNVPNLNVVIVGDGKNRSSFETALLKIVDKSRLNFLGVMDKNAMEIAWSKIGVLLSTAKNESYGRAIRESLCHGIPVLAYESSGVSSLQDESLSNWISIIGFPINHREIVDQFKKLMSLRTDDSYLEFQKLRQSTLADEIAQSWLKMIS